MISKFFASLGIPAQNVLFLSIWAMFFLLPSSSLSLPISLGLLTVVVIFVVLSYSKSIPLNAFFCWYISFFLLHANLISIDGIVNVSRFDLKNCLESFRILIFLSFFSFGYWIGYDLDRKFFFRISFSILLFQLVISLLSAYFHGPTKEFLSLVWSMDKSRYWRQVGTFANPNRLAFFSYVLAFTCLLFGQKIWRFKRPLGFTILGILVILLLLSSSRTAIIGFPFLLFTLFVLEAKTWKHRVILGLGIPIITAGVFLAGLEILGKKLHYLKSIVDLAHYDFNFKTVVNSLLDSRFDIWRRLLTTISDTSELQHAFFGFGPDKSNMVVADNNFIFIFYRYGVLGLLLHLGFWFSFLALAFAYRKRDQSIAHFIIIYWLLLFIFSMTFESFSNLIMPIPFFIVAGIFIRKLSPPSPGLIL